MSQQLTISSLFSALALVSLALVARTGDLGSAQSELVLDASGPITHTQVISD